MDDSAVNPFTVDETDELASEAHQVKGKMEAFF